MNEILYVLAGAAAPVAVQLLASFFQSRSEKRRLEQERRLKVIDIYESKRQQAIAEYTSLLGAMQSYYQIDAEFTVGRYLACASNASVYVSKQARDLIERLTNVILNFHSGKVSDDGTVLKKRFLIDVSFEQLSRELLSLLHDEMRENLFKS